MERLLSAGTWAIRIHLLAIILFAMVFFRMACDVAKGKVWE